MSKKETATPKVNANLIVVGVWLAIVVVLIGGYLLFLRPQSGKQAGPAQNTLDAEINQLNKQVASNPKDITAMIRLGQDYSKEKRYQDALGVFQAVLKQDSSNTAAMVNMAAAKMAIGKGDEAGPLLDKALKIQPDYDFGKFMQAIYLARVKKDYPASLEVLAGLRKEIKDNSKLKDVDNLIRQVKQAQSQASSSSATP